MAISNPEPFDPDMLPPHVRAALDQLSDLRYELMALIVRRRAEQAAHIKEATGSPSQEIPVAS